MSFKESVCNDTFYTWQKRQSKERFHSAEGRSNSQRYKIASNGHCKSNQTPKLIVNIHTQTVSCAEETETVTDNRSLLRGTFVLTANSRICQRKWKIPLRIMVRSASPTRWWPVIQTKDSFKSTYFDFFRNVRGNREGAEGLNLFQFT